MIADIIVDMEQHVRDGHVYLVEVELPWHDENAEPSYGAISYDLYLIATSSHQASYIASCLYPAADGIFVNDEPITQYQYAARRNRSILQGSQGDD